MENFLVHGAKVTEIRIHYREDADSFAILVKDNRPGKPETNSKAIFSWE